MEDKTMKEKTVNYMDGFFGTVSLKIVLGYLKKSVPCGINLWEFPYNSYKIILITQS